MKPRVYVEMSVVSYLDARLSRDVVILGNQVVAREWRRDAEERFELVVCGLVFEDAGDGDPQAVRDWLAPGRPRHLPLNANAGRIRTGRGCGRALRAPPHASVVSPRRRCRNGTPYLSRHPLR